VGPGQSRAAAGARPDLGQADARVLAPGASGGSGPPRQPAGACRFGAPCRPAILHGPDPRIGSCASC